MVSTQTAAKTSHSFTASDGTPLRADFYAPTADSEGWAPGGLVVLLHGYCEHRGRYGHVAEHLVSHGYTVIVGDLRGHGESGGERAFVNRFADYLDDVTALLSEGQAQDAAARRARNAPQPKAPLLVSHSMGGLVALEYVLAHPSAFRAVALSSPFLGLRIAVPAWKRGLGLVASMVRPTLRLPNELSANALSHEAAVCRAYETDPLVTHEATARWFTEAMAAQADVRTRAGRIQIPALFMCAGDDQIVDTPTAQRIFDRVGSRDKTFTAYPGLFHELFNETSRDRVLTDLSNWLKDR